MLITAGHNIYGQSGRVRITYPGLRHLNYTQLTDGRVATIDCTVVGTLYTKNGPCEKDIAILHAGSHNAADVLQLSAELPQPNEFISVIGYPGELKSEWMKTQIGIKDVDSSLDAAAKLLPKRTLTVSRGAVKSTGATMAYTVSTCPGMSGSCVLYKGKVIGKDQIKCRTDYATGVHVGQHNSAGSLPSAVSFTGQDVINLFRQQRLLNLIS